MALADIEHLKAIHANDSRSAVAIADRPRGSTADGNAVPQQPVTVTWRVSLADFVGDEIVAKIAALYRHHDPAGLRFIVGWG